MKLELAPAAVIRAAAWPIETLEVFGKTTLEREREALWNLTVEDPQFMKALLLASPSLFERVRAHPRTPGPRKKSVRHLETALYRYLARACSRSTPNQLWAGVALARFGEQDRIESAIPHADFGPELAPFALALRALGPRARYREAAQWRLSPTLRRQQDGTWNFMTRAYGGRVEIRQMSPDPTLDRHVDDLGNSGTGTLRELSQRSNVPMDVLARLADAGILLGGLSFPTRFASPFEALDLAAGALIGQDQIALKRARSSLAEIHDQLGSHFDRMTADDMVGLMARARGIFAELFAALDIIVAVPRTPFRCDLRLPFAITLGAGIRKQLQENLNAYQREWIDDVSPSSAARRERRRAITRVLESDPLPIGAPIPELPLNQNSNERSPDLCCSAPWGSFIVQLGKHGVSRVIGINDSPVQLFARHGVLFDDGNDIEVWTQELFSQLKSNCGVTVGDLAVPFERNPNVLARPNFARLLVEPWGTAGIDLRRAELRAEAGAIIFHAPAVGSITAMSCSSASVFDRDPLAAALALSGFAEPLEDPSVQTTSQPAPGEAEAMHYAPRVGLSAGATIRPRRTYLGGVVLEELTRVSGQGRFLHWRKLADRLGWPDCVTVTVDNEPPLTVLSSSPLAIEAALQGASQANRILVEEANPSGWISGSQGNHVAEVIVPFARNPHAFSASVK